MQFDSFADFIAMGKYGFYVWLSYGFGLIILCLLVLSSYAENKAIKKRIIEQQKRDKKLKMAQQTQQNNEQNL